ncbi:DUF7660 family protein [Pelagibius sp.]|uniref:DUF7660 family protein n=1 Tax=Pelagibius sp. TaxID=1931238 RepID=UPI003B505200
MDHEEVSPTTKEPEDLIPQIQTKQDFIEFMQVLRCDLEEHPERWENLTLHDFLQAIEAWVGSMENINKNLRSAPREEPDWQTVAEILFAASMYE